METIEDEGCKLVEEAWKTSPLDLQDIVSDYAAQAAELTSRYYGTLREMWGAEDDYAAIGSQVSRILWDNQGGFSGTDYNGLKYEDAVNGRSRAGVGIDDLWPSLQSADDWQQFLGDMVATAARTTMRENIAADLSRPPLGARSARQGNVRVLLPARLPRLRPPVRGNRRQGRHPLPRRL